MERIRKIFENNRNSEEGTFEVVYRLLFDKVLGFVTKIVRNEEDAIDITQEVFLKLWETRDDITINTSLKSYIYKSTKNRALNHLRSQRTERVYSENQAAIISELFDTVAHYDARSTYTDIRKCVFSMPEPRREIFVLSRKSGMTNEKIAQKLGISIKTVEYHISKALTELRKVVKE